MTFETCLAGYLKYLAVKNYALGTIEWRKTYLRKFFNYLETKDIHDLRAVTRENIENYKVYLKTAYTTRYGTPLTDSSYICYVTAITDFFHWLEQTGQILMTPALKSEKTLRSHPLRLPKVLSEEEVLKILESCPVNTPTGLRDRAILELLYSTGIRRSELTNLNVADYHPDQRELMIIDGKGRKDRVVPVGEYACLFVDAYLKMIRLWLVGSPEEKALFVDSMNGGRLSLQTVAYIVKKAVKRSGVGKGKKITPHTFRHTMATHLLRNQADLRHIQAILGHVSVASTEIYTHLTVENLRQAVKKAHPKGVRKEPKKDFGPQRS